MSPLELFCHVVGWNFFAMLSSELFLPCCWLELFCHVAIGTFFTMLLSELFLPCCHQNFFCHVVGWNFFAMLSVGTFFADSKDVILLDGAPSAHVFCKERMVGNTRDANKHPALMMGGGLFQAMKKADAPQCCEVWMDELLMMNVFSLTRLMDKCQIAFDSAVKSAFVVHASHGVLKFHRGPENAHHTKPCGCVGRKPPAEIKVPPEGHFPQMQFHSQRQMSRAKRAHDLLHAMGCPSIADLKKILKMSGIANCLITLDDIDATEKIHGPNVASLKGKTTRQKPAPVVSDCVSIPQELAEKHQNVTLCLDVTFANKKPFLAVISKKIKH